MTPSFGGHVIDASTPVERPCDAGSRQFWRLDDSQQTLVLSAQNLRLPEVIYWGRALPKDEDLEVLAKANRIDVASGMLDTNPELSICPEASRSFPGQPGIDIRDGDGTPLLTRFVFDSESASDTSLVLHYADPHNGLTYSASFELDTVTHVIVTSATLEADRPVRLHSLSAPVMPAPQDASVMTDFAGRHCGEFQAITTPWSAGIRLRENRTGRTGHEHFPGLYVPCNGATNTDGRAYAFHYGWSGGHRMVAEELPDGRRQIQFGHTAGSHIHPGKKFSTAPLYQAFSTRGMNGCAIGFQRHLRERIVRHPHHDRPRPVHYNCWEAVYFDHDLSEMKDIATRAADLGAERFVLDDGWFGRRDDDTSSLGDWFVDHRKYPDGLEPLISHVKKLGMGFGLWLEPEMINRNSELHRKHPEWVLGDGDQITGRHQYVLNLAMPEVRDHLFQVLAEILSSHDIEYIKWDHNRVLPQPDADQTAGAYELLDRLVAEYPDVEIESCASGGARIDFGILERTHRVWLSDSNDALERLKIQHQAALFLPSSVTGSHVGPRTSHTSGRTLSMAFRAWVAAQRHMGFEMDPRELTEKEKAVLKKITQWWKDNRQWLMQADILRLECCDNSVVAEQQLAADGNRFVVFSGRVDTSTQTVPRPLQLTELERSALYEVHLVNSDEISRGSKGDAALKEGPLRLSGTYLEEKGLVLPWSFPEAMWVVEGRRIA